MLVFCSSICTCRRWKRQDYAAKNMRIVKIGNSNARNSLCVLDRLLKQTAQFMNASGSVQYAQQSPLNDRYEKWTDRISLKIEPEIYTYFKQESCTCQVLPDLTLPEHLLRSLSVGFKQAFPCSRRWRFLKFLVFWVLCWGMFTRDFCYMYTAVQKGPLLTKILTLHSTTVREACNPLSVIKQSRMKASMKRRNFYLWEATFSKPRRWSKLEVYFTRQ